MFFQTDLISPTGFPGAVKMSATEVAARVFELPAKSVPLRVVAGPGDEALVTALEASGRQASIVTPEESPSLPGIPRLWKPNDLIEGVITQRNPGRALDLGCGTGRDAVALAKAGWQVVAIDILPDAIERAKQLESRYLAPDTIDWRVGPAEVLDGTFDLISMHFFLDRQLIRDGVRALQPGGVFALETFTEIHRERFGKPTPDKTISLESLEQEFTLEWGEEAWHGERHTVQALLQA